MDLLDAGSEDSRMRGFPPDPPQQVALDTWQDPPNQRWAFRHMRELIPSQVIAAGAPRPLPERPEPVGHLAVGLLNGTQATVDDVLASTWTDAFIVLHEAHLVEERYLAGMTARTPHLLMSVSKSVVGCVAATLASEGLISPDRLVSDFVPEISGSGYEGASVRHLLDMRTGVRFRETYTEPDAEVRVMERAMGWRSRHVLDPVGAYAYLRTIAPDGAHGGTFTYRSADTDLLGWVCERAAGTRMADLVSARIWQPIGAEQDAAITCDAVGTAIHDGGISSTARDLARFGQILLDDGRRGDTQVIPQPWLADSWTPGPDVRAAFASSENEAVLTGGWYRNQFWFLPGLSGDVLLCLGIHGQMVHVDRATRTVCVKLSSWPDAQNAGYLIDTLRAFAVVGAHLAGHREPDASANGRVRPPRRWTKGASDPRTSRPRPQ
jgi:CubicO group peptidase (beta-lactamase class C family)